MTHLTDNARVIAQLTDAERIEKILSEKWIGYTRAKKITDRLEDLLVHPKTHRMPNLLIVGDTNNGKTQLLNKFFNNHKPIIQPEITHLNAPVVYIQAPSQPEEAKFYNAILERVFAPYKLNDRIEKKQHQAISILRNINTRILIIDEIHHILAGSYNKQRIFLNVIKYIANELQIVIVAAGIKDAFNAINTDAQLSNRFEPAILPRWEMGEEYLRLLKSFESILPLKKASDLIDTDLALKILSMSEGTIGEISTILKKAAIQAIKTKSERIDKKALESIDYIPPSDRKKQYEKFR